MWFKEVVGAHPAFLMECSVANSADMGAPASVFVLFDAFLAFGTYEKLVIFLDEFVEFSRSGEGVHHLLGSLQERVFHAPWFESAGVRFDDGEPFWYGFLEEHSFVGGGPLWIAQRVVAALHRRGFGNGMDRGGLKRLLLLPVGEGGCGVSCVASVPVLLVSEVLGVGYLSTAYLGRYPPCVAGIVGLQYCRYRDVPA